MEQNQLPRLQKHLFGMMKEIHQTLTTNHIRYYMISGSLLGAVRHRGFIPWDDDMDIAIPRADYDRLIREGGDILPKHLEFVCGEKNADYPLQFGKIQDTRTTVIEKAFRHDLGGIYIDVFPLDGVPSGKVARWWHLFRFGILAKLLYLVHRDPFKHGHGIRSWIPLLLQKTVSKERAHRLMRRLLVSNDFETATLVSPHRHHTTQVFPKRILGNPTPIRFNDTEFLSVEHPHDYLSLYYGDYMKEPAPGKRRQHNFYLLDFDHSYKDYN